jgi:acetyl esterase/lipase
MITLQNTSSLFPSPFGEGLGVRWLRSREGLGVRWLRSREWLGVRWLALILIFLSLLPVGAQKKADFPRDTTFSVLSAAKKIEKDFPQASPVREFKNLDILSHRDIPYKFTGKRNLHLDIFTPGDRRRSKRPLIICLHGGGWASGNKSHLVPLSQQLAARGYVAATIEYRLSPEARYPAGVLDVKDAILWLKIHADDYGIDTIQVAILGTSAGATIASLVAFTSDNPLFETGSVTPGIHDNVQVLVNIDGVLDFTDPSESGKDKDPAKPSAATRWFGYTYKQKPELWVEASPLTYAEVNGIPSLFINSALPRFHAGRDRYLEILDARKIYHEVHTIPDTPHPFWLFHPWFNETLEIISHFLALEFPHSTD